MNPLLPIRSFPFSPFRNTPSFFPFGQARAVRELLQRNMFELEHEAQLKDGKLANLRREHADTLVLRAYPILALRAHPS